MHPITQSELRKEIRRAHEGISSDKQWDYDELMHLPLLDAVVRETLRMFNPVSWIWRIAREETSLPLRKPIVIQKIKNHSDETGRKQDGGYEDVDHIPVAKGQGVVIGIAAAHRDKTVWGAHANEWNPNNWLGNHLNQNTNFEEEENELIFSSPLDYEDRYPGIYSGM